MVSQSSSRIHFSTQILAIRHPGQGQMVSWEDLIRNSYRLVGQDVEGAPAPEAVAIVRWLQTLSGDGTGTVTGKCKRLNQSDSQSPMVL